MLVLSSTCNSGSWYMLTRTVSLEPAASDFNWSWPPAVLLSAEIRVSSVHIHLRRWHCQQDGQVLFLTGVLMVLAAGRLLFRSALRFHLDLFSLLSETFNATLWRLNPAEWWCHPRNIIPAYQAFRLPPSSVWYFRALSPSFFSLPLSSLLFLSSPLPARSHPPPLCPLTTWHLFRFIPISWQTACISARGAQCSDPRESMADKSMLSLFSMPLLPSIFLFFFFLLLCCLWRLELCSIKLSSLSGTNCSSVRLSARKTDTNVSSGRGVQELYLWDAPVRTGAAVVFTEAEPGFIGIVNPLSDEARWRLFPW